MQLYHGSTIQVPAPIISSDVSRRTDFGRGFYTTTSQQQARRWAQVKQQRAGNSGPAIVNIYDLSESAFHELSLCVFEAATERWLEFVMANRTGRGNVAVFDIVRGPVADDTLYTTLTLYESGILTAAETIARLKTYTLFDQISFHTARALAELRYVRGYEV